MFKTILVFIKTHVVATTITTIVVVGTAVATPIVIKNYNLDKNVKENSEKSVSSNNQTINDYQTTNSNEVNNPIDSNEPLTFRIEKVVTQNENDECVEYKIIPSYEKEHSKWTKEDIENYEKTLKEINKLSEEEHEKTLAKEKQTMQNMEISLQKVIQSYSKEYYFMGTNESAWRYNSYAKLYDSGTATEIYGENIYKTIQISGGNLSGVTIEDFRSIVYPSIKQKIKADNSMYEQMMSDLEELYHLSD